MKRLLKKLLRIINRNKKPTLYNKLGNPIMPPLGSRRHPKTKKRKTQHHKLQKPSNFTESEVDEILKRVKPSTKNQELELSPP